MQLLCFLHSPDKHAAMTTSILPQTMKGCVLLGEKRAEMRE